MLVTYEIWTVAVHVLYVTVCRA